MLDVMPSDKEIICRVVDLEMSDPQYQEVHEAFTSTVTSKEHRQLERKGTRVVKIQRIQNPTLCAQYAHRKEIIDKQNPNIRTERWLFHGCKESFVKNIYRQGFNKSIADCSCKCCMYATLCNTTFVQQQYLVEEYALMSKLIVQACLNCMKYLNVQQLPSSCFMLVSSLETIHKDPLETYL